MIESAILRASDLLPVAPVEGNLFISGLSSEALEDGIELSPQLPLSSVAQLSVEIKDRTVFIQPLGPGSLVARVIKSERRQG